MKYEIKEEIYSSKTTEIANEVDFGAFTNYNWWRQVKAHVEPLLNSLEANINVSLALRDEQIDRSKSKHRLVPIDKEHCLVLSHTKQFENKVDDAIFNTAYIYKCDWASIMAQFANKGKEGKYLINLTCQKIFKRYGKGRTYLLRKEGDFDGKCGVKAIKALLNCMEVKIPINGREYWDFILPCKKQALSLLRRLIAKKEQGGENIETWNLYHNYSVLFHVLNVEHHRILKRMIATLSSFFKGGDKIEQSVKA